MDTHVTYENIRALLIGLKTKMNTEINAVDLTDEQKATLAKAEKIITTGDGNSFLADDGTYKAIPLADLQDIEDKIGKVVELFNIQVDGDTVTYNIPEIDEAVAKANIIKTDGAGDKVLTDNGEYINFTPVGTYREMTEDEITTLMNEIDAI